MAISIGSSKSDEGWVHLEAPTQKELKEHIDQERKQRMNRIYKDGIYPVAFAILSSQCSLKVGLMCITTLGVMKDPLVSAANGCIRYLSS